MISLLLLACSAKVINVGMVDIAEEKICTVQLADESFVEVESELCASLQEGDILRVIRGVR
tara:strand:+ start:176 stop:358 length:183 start_codon:yes stop_codon:yes gene_type:complete